MWNATNWTPIKQVLHFQLESNETVMLELFSKANDMLPLLDNHDDKIHNLTAV